MAAATTDKFTKVGTPGTATNLSAPGYTIGGTTLTVVSTTNWPSDTKVFFAIDVVETVNGEEVRVDGSYCEFEGIVASGTSISNVAKTYGTAQDYAAGVTTRVYIPVSSSRENAIIDGLNVEHNLNGTHKEDLITDRTEDTTPADDDYVLTSDTSASAALKKSKVINLVRSGAVVQFQGASNSTDGTTTTLIPADNLGPPQNTEGAEVATQAITPKATSNKLVIEAWQVVATPAGSSTVTIALFQDSNANALAAAEFFQTQSSGIVTLYVKHIMDAGTTSATTFKYRVGSNTAGTLTYGTRYGTASTGGISITEYKA